MAEPWWQTATPALVLAAAFIIGAVALLVMAIAEGPDGWGMGLGSIACAVVGVAAARLWWRVLSRRVAVHRAGEGWR
jgi:membrane protein implicated in regulation of membrane protease activity